VIHKGKENERKEKLKEYNNPVSKAVCSAPPPPPPHKNKKKKKKERKKKKFPSLLGN
jgi:hypothetical protein